MKIERKKSEERIGERCREHNAYIGLPTTVQKAVQSRNSAVRTAVIDSYLEQNLGVNNDSDILLLHNFPSRLSNLANQLLRNILAVRTTDEILKRYDSVVKALSPETRRKSLATCLLNLASDSCWQSDYSIMETDLETSSDPRLWREGSKIERGDGKVEHVLWGSYEFPNPITFEYELDLEKVQEVLQRMRGVSGYLSATKFIRDIQSIDALILDKSNWHLKKTKRDVPIGFDWFSTHYNYTKNCRYVEQKKQLLVSFADREGIKGVNYRQIWLRELI